MKFRISYLRLTLQDIKNFTLLLAHIMKLYVSINSPYSRKCRMVAHENGLIENDIVETIFVKPYEDPAALHKANPLGKVPTAVLDGDMILYDSRLITAFMDKLSPQIDLIPADGPSKWAVLRAEALADGINDESIALFFDLKKEEDQQDTAKNDRRKRKIINSIKTIKQELLNLPQELTLGHIALAAALGYIDLRFSTMEWRKDNETVAIWFDDFAKRDSFQATMTDPTV